MQAATGDIESIQQAITDIVEACNKADTSSVQTDTETDLPVLGQTLSSLLDVMQRVQGDAGSTGTEDVTEIGEYAIRLIENLAATVEKLGLQEQKNALADLFLNIGLWIAHQGGLIDTLEPIVDAVAMSANSSRSPQELEALSEIIRQIIEAVPATISQELETLNPGRPWRVLLLNHCIVATRSHNPELMETAFAVLTGNLPADAPRFFSEGMQQMEALDYPDHVRTVMEKYHRKWNVDRSLH
jgi:hypothetical protein